MQRCAICTDGKRSVCAVSKQSFEWKLPRNVFNNLDNRISVCAACRQRFKVAVK